LAEAAVAAAACACVKPIVSRKIAGIKGGADTAASSASAGVRLGAGEAEADAAATGGKVPTGEAAGEGSEVLGEPEAEERGGDWRGCASWWEPPGVYEAPKREGMPRAGEAVADWRSP
jgi:hypothetical protein